MSLLLLTSKTNRSGGEDITDYTQQLTSMEMTLFEEGLHMSRGMWENTYVVAGHKAVQDILEWRSRNRNQLKASTVTRTHR